MSLRYTDQVATTHVDWYHKILPMKIFKNPKWIRFLHQPLYKINTEGLQRMSNLLFLDLINDKVMNNIIR